ncbi:MAG: aminoacyl-tRNA hydrolase [Flavobacteriaceae bacterium]|nr:aminoacyl-tRNA hydrolase [Flavobacteriaceae bacterium]RCL68523.1 MAG: aminoacyl-tRNA hydrolase [Bacteroidota bacterium]
MDKFLIVGLGNPGDKYDNTRHNIGFDILDFFCKKNESKFESSRLGDLATISVKGRKVFLLKPTTYMNLSGKSVKYWMKEKNIRIDNLLVISDDLNLPIGKIRFRSKGSSGGHNGLENIESSLNSKEYSRLRIGISNEENKINQIDFVLGRFSDSEYKILFSNFEIILNSLNSFVLSGINETMNNYNN